MKIQMKTIASDYNEETGLSKVTVATDLGLITCYASLHPEDAEIASHFAGCRYAEMRAGIKYMKEKAKIAKFQLEPLQRVYNTLTNKKNCDMNNKGIKLLEKEIYILVFMMKIIQKYNFMIVQMMKMIVIFMEY